MADPDEDAELVDAYNDLVRLQAPKTERDMVPRHLRRRRHNNNDNNSAEGTSHVEQVREDDNKGVEEPSVDEEPEGSEKVALSSEAEDRENFHRWMWRRSGTLHSYIIGTFAAFSAVWAWRVGRGGGVAHAAWRTATGVATGA